MTRGTVAVYAEPARSYRGVAYSVGGIVLGYLLDLLLSGPSSAVSHLPGWLVLGGLLVGVQALVVHAARATKSLSLTTDELRVGDEKVARAAITGVGDEPSVETPVLGWPAGMPRGVGSVLLRLATGSEVIVPTRYPDRLLTAIAVRESERRVALVPRPATEDDYPLIADVDRRAEAIFRVAGHALPEIDFDEDALRSAAAVFVLADPPVGFIRVDEVDGLAHVSGLAVLPSDMRRGYGTALLERACAWANENRYPAITLTTYADIAWNAPFYARRGFAERAETTPRLAALRERERRMGLDDVGRRVVMRREL